MSYSPRRRMHIAARCVPYRATTTRVLSEIANPLRPATYYTPPTAPSCLRPLPAAADSFRDIPCTAANRKKIARIEAGHRHFDPCSVGFHFTSVRVILRPRFTNLLRLPRQIHVRAGPPGYHQRRIPERVPLLTLDDFRC